MRKISFFLAIAFILSACGGGSGSESESSRESALPTSQTAKALPNEHGLYPDANNVTQTDAEAGIYPNENGFARSFSTAGTIDTSNPFFKSFGNGRSCASCHKQEDGFSITTATLNRLFDSTEGNDSVFQLIDGANSPQATANTLEEKKAAYSMLLNRGVFRIGRKIPASAEFELIAVDDPYHFASADELSLYRRPLPSANLRFLTDVMWDGRETAIDQSSKICNLKGVCFASLDSNLGRQANNATLDHAQTLSDLSIDDQNAIVAFEKTLFVAQQVDNAAGLLFGAAGTGGAMALSAQQFSFGDNDIFFQFNGPISFSMFNSWINDKNAKDPAVSAARDSIKRGQAVFNNKPILVGDSSELSRLFSGPGAFVNCSNCHSVPDVGNLGEPQSFNIGIADAKSRTPDMPLYTLRNKETGETIQTQDPGAAMTTGRWKDIGRFKVPILRGLSTRAPYFHDGSAKTIEDVTNFYKKQFDIKFSDQELADLNAFLKAL